MATRIRTAKKMLTDLLDGVEVGQREGDMITITKGEFTCKFPDGYSRADLISRAAAIDRCTCQRKVDGGLKVQAAMVFITANRAIAKDIQVVMEKNMINGRYGYHAKYGRQQVEKVDFNQADYLYALEVLRIK